jgi:AraC-like DNA-binding protein
MSAKHEAPLRLSELGLPRLTFAGDFTVKAGSRLGPRTLPEFEIVYFPVPSRTEYTVGDRKYSIDDPCLIVTRPGEPHAYSFDPDVPTRHLFFHFVYPLPEDRAYPFDVLMPGKPPLVRMPDTSPVPQLLRHILALAHTRPLLWSDRCRLLLQAVLGEIEACAAVPSGPAPPEQAQALPAPIRRALEYIEQHLHERFSVQEIAAQLGWSHEHFSRQFARYTGLTPRQAVLQRRIRRACQLLVQETWPVKRIAYEVGFEDEHYFSRCFAKLQGMTASEFRRRYSDPRASHLAPVDSGQMAYPLNHYFYFDPVRTDQPIK